MDPALMETALPDITIHARGKVRDIFRADGRLLLVATDRISAFDRILRTGIPKKGMILTQLSLFWFDFLEEIVRNHFLTARVEEYPESFGNIPDQLQGRSMLVCQANPIPVECVVRGYISGSGWKDYQATGKTGGITLPAGMCESERLSEPIFTPATKAVEGHDENISFEKMANQIGSDLARQLRERSMALYEKASRHAESCGVILADTKFEFGTDADGVLLIDEALTPDSSRYWPRDRYRPGGPQISFDKQYVRDYVESIDWNKQPPAPELPADVVARTMDKYLEIFRRLTGREPEW